MDRTVRVAGPLTTLAPAPLVDGSVHLTAEEAGDHVARVAGGLAERGVGAGDVVAFPLPTSWEAVLLLHACWRLGAVAAPVHHRAGAAERDRLLARLRPRVVVTELPAGGRAPPADVGPDDLALLLATSGTSGAPKLVRHTHRTLRYKADLMVGVHGLDDTDAVLVPAPIAHISGLLNGVLLPAAAGMRTVLLRRWDRESAAAAIARERITFVAGPPTFFVDLAGAARPEQVRTLRLVSTGGATVTPAFVERASDRLDAFVKRTYGSTEAPTITTSHAGDPPERARDTDGRPTGSVQLRLRPGGELEVRGPELFTGYHDDPRATDAALGPDGWFRTGDLARLDGDWLTVVGRVTDTIIRGGENVSPAEVEAVCATLDGVRDVVVVGFADGRLGQRIGLVTVGAAPDLDAVRRHCLAAGLTPFKVPERVLALDEVPRLATGKPDRSALAALLEHVPRR